MLRCSRTVCRWKQCVSWRHPSPFISASSSLATGCTQRLCELSEQDHLLPSVAGPRVYPLQEVEISTRWLNTSGKSAVSTRASIIIGVSLKCEQGSWLSYQLQDQWLLLRTRSCNQASSVFWGLPSRSRSHQSQTQVRMWIVLTAGRKQYICIVTSST